MCLAVPMELVEVDGARGVAESRGVRAQVRLDLVEGAQVGRFVLIHAGYAIQLLDAAEAAETLALLHELEADRSAE